MASARSMECVGLLMPADPIEERGERRLLPRDIGMVGPELRLAQRQRPSREGDAPQRAAAGVLEAAEIVVERGDRGMRPAEAPPSRAQRAQVGASPVPVPCTVLADHSQAVEEEDGQGSVHPVGLADFRESLSDQAFRRLVPTGPSRHLAPNAEPSCVQLEPRWSQHPGLPV
jgi:hypothetical protein